MLNGALLLNLVMGFIPYLTVQINFILYLSFSNINQEYISSHQWSLPYSMIKADFVKLKMEFDDLEQNATSEIHDLDAEMDVYDLV